MIWDVDLFTKEFEHLKECIDEPELPPLFRNQLDKINEIVAHWKVCPACKLGFYCCQYDTSFESVCLNLIFYPPDYHTCDSDYKLLFTKATI